MGDQFITVLTTTPPWLHRCYFVHILDFCSTDDGYWDDASVRTKSALFVQTKNDPIAGMLYSIRREAYSGSFVYDVRPCENPQHDPTFESDAVIGFIFKNDFEKHFPFVVASVALPHATNSSSAWHGLGVVPHGRSNGSGWRPPLRNSTD